MDKYLFFGYGANRDKKRIEDILKASELEGEDLEVKGGEGARVDGLVLAIQDLTQIPEKVQEVLEKVWGDSFRAYTLKPGIGQVAGVIWELNERQFKALKDWEFDGVWREVIEREVIASDQRKIKVYTEKAFDNSPIKEIVDGLNYENNLNIEGMKVSEVEDDEYRIKALVDVRRELSTL